MPWCPASRGALRGPLRGRRDHRRGDRVEEEAKWTQGTGEGGGDAFGTLDVDVERPSRPLQYGVDMCRSFSWQVSYVSLFFSGLQ